jgi:hypothetical protein
MRFLFIALVIGLFPACTLEPFPQESDLTGKWLFNSSRGQLVIEIADNHTFTVSNATSKSKMMWGKWSYDKGVISMTNTGGRFGENCEGEGLYEVFHEDGNLRFEPKKDRCNSRKNSMQEVWVPAD